MPDPISWEFAWPYLAAALAGGYLLGSVPFGLVLTRLAGLGDLRKIGSGNIGATNVLRTGRKGLAAATVLLDGGKGAAAVLIAGIWGPDSALMAGLGALLGHLYPVWLGFKGGKGVATALGTLLAIAWPVGIACCLTWLAVAAAFRFSSLAALLALLAAPGYAWWFLGDLQMVEFAAIVAALVWVRHQTNIRRLLKGEEPKIGRGGERRPTGNA
ncbi:MAG: glycerol-3-phosphate 1-O-acyltransferase PlsY [Kiloniellales bacterium]|nr:glycerol-3-phosphate 1-O-acyltransferase PlsY [Kiloniellales bacterium]